VSRKPLILGTIAVVFVVSLLLDIALYRMIVRPFTGERRQTPLDQCVVEDGELDPGILMATDENGLRSLAEKPPLEVKLIDENGDLMLGRIHLGPWPTPQPKNGQVLVLNGTEALSTDTKILLKDGRLVDLYFTSNAEMDEAEAVKVVHIRITEGPQRDLEGWVRWDEVQSTPRYAPFR